MSYSQLKSLNFLFAVILSASIFSVKTYGYGTSADSITAPVLFVPLNNSVYQKTSGLNIEWSSSNEATSYEFQYATDSSFSYSSIAGDFSTADTSGVIYNLKNNTRYYWRVRGKIGFVAGNWSVVWSFNTTPLPSIPLPESPEDGLRNINTLINFEWSGSPQNKSYQFQLAQDSNFTGYVVNISTPDTSATVYSTSNNSYYYWRVRAFDADSTPSRWSVLRSFKTKLAPVPLIKPYGKSLDTTLNFKWLSTPGAETYRLQISESTDFNLNDILADTLFADSGSFIYTFKPGMTYYWRMLAFNSAGDSSGWTDTLTMETKYTAPELLTPSNNVVNLDSILTLSWDTLGHAKFYRVTVAEDSSFSRLTEDSTLAGSEIKLSGLLYHKYYYWRVNKVGEDGNTGYWSEIRSFKTRLSPPLLTAPAVMSIANSDSVRLKWASVNGAQYYRLQAAYDSLMTGPVVDSQTPDDFYILRSLIPDTTIYWRVIAQNDSGESSPWSAVFNFSTRQKLLFTPEAISDTVNFSDGPRDSLFVFTIQNLGGNSITFDSIKAAPDSIYKIYKTLPSLGGSSKADLELLFNPLKAAAGNNPGVVKLFTRAVNGQIDSMQASVSIFMRKAFAVPNTTTVIFDTTYSDSAGYNGVALNNYWGNIPLQIKNITVTGTDSAAFIMLTYPTTIKQVSSGYFSIQFVPQVLGVNRAELIIKTNAYPDSVQTIELEGTGTGGRLAAATIERLTTLKDSLFETFTSGERRITFKNTGSLPLRIGCNFTQKHFQLTAGDEINNLIIPPGDSAAAYLKYLTRDFHPVNTDTLMLYQSGVGNKVILFPLKGGFDKEKSLPEIIKNIKIDSISFPEAKQIYPAGRDIYIDVDSLAMTHVVYPNFRITYYIGGDSTRHRAYNPGWLKYFINSYNVDDRGLDISIELLTLGDNAKILDSISVIKNFDPQILLNGYKSAVIKVPRSIPAQTADKADVKWVMFGFPFDPVYTDTVFNYFGGRTFMKDGEWMLYKYDPSSAASFSEYSSESFPSGPAYFIAQALVDTFRISNDYYGSLLTRRLTDTVLSVQGNEWKTVSDPYTFDVQVQPPNMLYRYNTDKNSYELTNIMKPGEGYFVAPSDSQLNLKTFGTYDPQVLPDEVYRAGWFVKLGVSDKVTRQELTLSFNEKSGINKNNSSNRAGQYEAAPLIRKGLNAYINGDSSSGKYMVSVKSGGDGAVWDIRVSNNLSDDAVNLNTEESGNFPSGYKTVVYDEKISQIVDNKNYAFSLGKNTEYTFKVIIGTDEFVKNTLSGIKTNVPSQYSLSQNYPNPFNPSTVIAYQLPVNSFVTLKIYDILGNEIATLVDEHQNAGYHQIVFNAQQAAGNKQLSSGIYFYRLQAGSFTAVKKLVLLK